MTFVTVTKEDAGVAASEARHSRLDHGALHVRRSRSCRLPAQAMMPKTPKASFSIRGDESIVATIKELLETRVRPAVAQDGGDITFKGFRDGNGVSQHEGRMLGLPVLDGDAEAWRAEPAAPFHSRSSGSRSGLIDHAIHAAQGPVAAMIVLALDTAGTGCFAAVYDSESDVVLASTGADIGRGHAEKLMAFIDEALSESGKALADIDRIAVTVGPGSFTGIRVGVAAARGFALALAVPAVGISSLAVLAKAAQQAHQGQAIFAVMDAKRDEIYGQMFDASGAASSEAQAYDVDDARHLASGFDGLVCGSARELLLSGHVDADAPRYLADIGVVARLGATADPALGKPTPLYLRGPDAKPQLGFAVARA